MKKLNLKSLTITISLLFSLGASAYDFTVDGMYFNIVSLDDLTCEITQGDEKYTGDFVIPEQVTFNGRTLTIIRIDDYAFKGCDTLTSVKISDAVADIGSSAFEDCTKLTNVIISESVTTIGDSTFKGCANLSNVNIPESTTTIGNSTFEGCINLTNVNIPESVTTVGNSAFRYCTSLKNVDIPNSITTISNSVFEGCTSLTDVNIPNSITTINNFAFKGCTNLKNVDLPNSITFIGSSAFEGCTVLTDITIPPFVISIEDAAFSGCPNITNISIPSSIKSLGTSAFKGCIGIKKVIFEDSSESLSTPINTCFFDSPIEYFYMGREVGWDDEKEKGCKFIETIHKVTIGSFVSELKGNHFAYCTNLKELILDDNSNTLKLNESVSLGSGSKLIITPFNGCNIETLYYGRPISLTDYIITDSLKGIIVGDVTSIGNIFKSCENISTIKLTSNVPPTISNDCFTDKQFIYISVIVPSGSMPTYQSAEGWNKFWNITESDELVKFFVVNGIKYKIKSGNKVTVAKNTESYSGNIIIPSSVTYASKEYEVVDVGEAFSSSPNLLKVTLPSSLKNIAPYAFKDDTELQEVILPEGLLVLGAYAFYNSGLKTMTIPSTIISFGENAFNNCDKLKELIFEDGNIPLIFPTTKQVHRSKLYTSEINHKEYTYIYKQYCGYFCNLNIEKIYLGRNLSDERTYSLTYNGMSEWTLNQYNGPFECLPKLKELIIGENVSALGPDTYSEKFTLISNKLYMSYSPVASFKECNSIIKVKVNAVTPPTGADFSSTAYANATLVVPDNSIEDYKAATGWKEFYNIISESEATGISNVETNTEQNVKIENGNIVVENIRGIVNIYDIAGTLVKRVKADGNRIDITLPQRGIYIVKAGRTAVKVVI